MANQALACGELVLGPSAHEFRQRYLVVGLFVLNSTPNLVWIPPVYGRLVGQSYAH